MSQHISHYALIIIREVLSGGLVVINDKQEFRAGLLVTGMQCGAWSVAIKRYFSAEEIIINQMYNFATLSWDGCTINKSLECSFSVFVVTTYKTEFNAQNLIDIIVSLVNDLKCIYIYIYVFFFSLRGLEQ